MGLTAAFKGMDPSGVAQFDASSMVAWREKQTLERMKSEEIERAQVICRRHVSCALSFFPAPLLKVHETLELLW